MSNPTHFLCFMRIEPLRERLLSIDLNADAVDAEPMTEAADTEVTVNASMGKIAREALTRAVSDQAWGSTDEL